MEVAAEKAGPTTGVEGDPPSGPTDVAGEHTVGAAPRIHGELLKAWLFHLPGRRLEIHGPLPIAAIASRGGHTLQITPIALASTDFFVVPTATFHLLAGFIVLHHERRQIVHFGVTAMTRYDGVGRTADPRGIPAWLARRTRYLIRDRRRRIRAIGFRSTVTAMGVD